MSAPNFVTMEKFPLYARDFVSLYCPSCGEWMDGNEVEECIYCGSTLEHSVDYEDTNYVINEIQNRLNEANRGLMFHTISVEGGYYYGAQLYVTEDHDPNEYDNDECKYEFDMYRSIAIRRYNSEINKIERLLKKLAEEFGFDELYCCCMFSNGEARYSRVRKTKRSLVLQAATSIA